MSGHNEEEAWRFCCLLKVIPPKYLFSKYLIPKAKFWASHGKFDYFT